MGTQDYNRIRDGKCGAGGVHCYCCNGYKGKKKPILNRMIRRIIKRLTTKEIRQNID